MKNQAAISATISLPETVWIPKYRRKALYGECRRKVVGILRTLVEAKDHIHMCIRIPPKYAVSKTVGYLKGKSALILSDHHPERKTVTGRDRTFWARGYFVSTIGMDEAVIRKYVREREDASRIVQ